MHEGTSKLLKVCLSISYCKEKATTLSKYVWDNELQPAPSIQYEILKHEDDIDLVRVAVTSVSVKRSPSWMLKATVCTLTNVRSSRRCARIKKNTLWNKYGDLSWVGGAKATWLPPTPLVLAIITWPQQPERGPKHADSLLTKTAQPAVRNGLPVKVCSYNTTIYLSIYHRSLTVEHSLCRFHRV